MINGIPIMEAETLSVNVGVPFGSSFDWAAMIDKMVSLSRQCLGCLHRILDYLDSNTSPLTRLSLD